MLLLRGLPTSSWIGAVSVDPWVRAGRASGNEHSNTGVSKRVSCAPEACTCSTRRPRKRRRVVNTCERFGRIIDHPFGEIAAFHTKTKKWEDSFPPKCAVRWRPERALGEKRRTCWTQSCTFGDHGQAPCLLCLCGILEFQTCFNLLFLTRGAVAPLWRRGPCKHALSGSQLHVCGNFGNFMLFFPDSLHAGIHTETQQQMPGAAENRYHERLLMPQSHRCCGPGRILLPMLAWMPALCG